MNGTISRLCGLAGDITEKVGDAADSLTRDLARVFRIYAESFADAQSAVDDACGKEVP